MSLTSPQRTTCVAAGLVMLVACPAAQADYATGDFRGNREGYTQSRRISTMFGSPSITVGGHTLTCRSGGRLVEISSEGRVIYRSCFDAAANNEIPHWVVHRLTRENIANNVGRRDLRPWLSYEGLATGAGFTGYDLGHLAPRGDFAASRRQSDATYVVINRAPQDAQFNRNRWRCLEDPLRVYVSSVNAELVIVTGTAGVLATTIPHGNTRRVRVPQFFWKVVYSPTLGEAILFYSRNDAASDLRIVWSGQHTTFLNTLAQNAPPLQGSGVETYLASNDAGRLIMHIMQAFGYTGTLANLTETEVRERLARNCRMFTARCNDYELEIRGHHRVSRNPSRWYSYAWNRDDCSQSCEVELRLPGRGSGVHIPTTLRSAIKNKCQASSLAAGDPNGTHYPSHRQCQDGLTARSVKERNVDVTLDVSLTMTCRLSLD